MINYFSKPQKFIFIHFLSSPRRGVTRKVSFSPPLRRLIRKPKKTAGRPFSKLVTTNQHGLKGPDPKVTNALYRCLCGTEFTHRVSFNLHLRMKTFGPVFRCPHCQQRFSLHLCLKQHVNNVHKLVYNPENLQACGICGKVEFRNRRHLNAHRRTAHGMSR